MNVLLGIFIILHGLVHLWYITLNLRLVEFQAQMGWSGKSWLLTPLLGAEATRWIATTLYGLATLGFVAGGIGILSHQTWWRTAVIASAVLSAVAIFLLWDGGRKMLVEKGLIGLVIDVVLLVTLLINIYEG